MTIGRAKYITSTYVAVAQCDGSFLDRKWLPHEVVVSGGFALALVGFHRRPVFAVSSQSTAFSFVPMPLFQGHFVTTIAGAHTSVEFTIRNNYEVLAKFTSYGVKHVFNMKKWMKTKEETMKPTSSFDKFAQLMLDRFWPESDQFGSIEKDGGVRYAWTNEQLLNMLKYATREVFLCAEEIISRHRRSLLDYCVFYREKDKTDTYESYIHLVACHCLVQSNFLAPTVHFDEVPFAYEERTYQRDLIPTIQQSGQDVDDEDE